MIFLEVAHLHKQHVALGFSPLFKYNQLNFLSCTVYVWGEKSERLSRIKGISLSTRNAANYWNFFTGLKKEKKNKSEQVRSLTIPA